MTCYPGALTSRSWCPSAARTCDFPRRGPLPKSGQRTISNTPNNAAPKESVTDIIRIARRALRPHGDADTATIIVPAPAARQPRRRRPRRRRRCPRRRRPVPARAARRPRSVRTRRNTQRRAGTARASRAPDGGGGQQLPAQITVQAPDGTLARTLDALRVTIINGTASSWWDGYG